MALAKVDNAQRDFSAGEVDISMKRNEEHEVFKKGLRKCVNFRILDSTKLSQRLGRTAKFIDGPRVDEILMSAGNVFYLVFGNHALSVYNAAGTQVFTSTKLGDGATTIPWTTATAKNVRWDVYQLSIYIAYADGAPANVPQILTWDGVSQTSSWTLSTYAELVLSTQKRTPFFRISPVGITITPSATTGAGITVTASSAVFTASHVGTRIRYIGRQILITAFTNSTTVTATVEENLFAGSTIHSNSADDIRTLASVGDVIIGAVSGARAQIISFVDASHMVVQYIAGNRFQVGVADRMVGPGGDLSTAAGEVFTTPQAVTLWDDEVMNAYRGYPSSVAIDQDRLIFSNFPSVPLGISWSAIGSPTDLYVPPVGISPQNAIFETTPGKNQVLDVVASNEGTEFVFCDNAVYGIPITAANPLSGSTGVAFNKITDDGSSGVQPRRMHNVIIYINAGGSSVCAIMTIGAYNRANESRDISEYHNHLLNSPIAIACPTADDPNFPERYFYVLNSDGTVVPGKVDVENGQVKTGTLPGWVRENGNGNVKWLSSRASNVMFTTMYQPGGAAAVTIAELRAFTQYLDAAMSYNSVPAPFTPGGGLGPLWWMANGTCTVMDLGTRQLGLYNIDANGFLVPQNFGGEDLTSVQLVVGQAWTGTVEPFVPAPGPGQDIHQRMFRRKIIRAAVYFINSTGFLWARLFSGPLRPGGPALGDQMNTRRVTTYNQDDDATLAPPLREGTDLWRPSGRAYDPRIAIIKDTAGPLTIAEIGMETTV